MRIRSIRPEFWTSEDVAGMSWPTRLVFIGLWSYVDDNGVGRDNERLITADLFPLDEDPHGALTEVAGALKHLEKGGQISRYMVDGKPFLHVTKWDKHQRINRPSEARYPLPTCENAEPHDVLTEPSMSPHADSPVGEGEKGRRGEGEKGAPRPAKRKPEIPLPHDWQPTETHVAYCREHQLDLGAEVFKFRNHAQANDRRQRVWNAAFSTWLANALEYRGPRRPQQDEIDVNPWITR